MLIKILCVGKLKEKFFVDACNEYCKRISRFSKIEIVEVEECPIPSKSLLVEGAKIVANLSGFVVLLDLQGKEFTSENFADFLAETKAKSSTITFVIGSSMGVDDSVKQMADAKISFSKMTFPHMLFRVMLCEQIYRAFMIDSGAKYHK